MNSVNCFVVGILVAMSCQFPFNGGRGACFLGLILTVASLWLCNCTDFCSFVLCRLPSDILLLVNSVIIPALLKLYFSGCFRVDLNPNRLLFPFLLPMCALLQSPL